MRPELITHMGCMVNIQRIRTPPSRSACWRKAMASILTYIFIRHSPFTRTRVLEAELMEEFSSLFSARPPRWLGLLLAFMTWRMPYSAFACKWVNDK
mmetsp:Transcript_47034/g.116461  ORF Transcript_47034/g.116461 Transcript_47034/m.116461 type:complete len:97 (-) Transcript_47034:250-540(-)